MLAQTLPLLAPLANYQLAPPAHRQLTPWSHLGAVVAVKVASMRGQCAVNARSMRGKARQSAAKRGLHQFGRTAHEPSPRPQVDSAILNREPQNRRGSSN